jgi:hypothetical protein
LIISFLFPLISIEDNHGGQLELGVPDDLDVSVELRNWLFALKGTDEPTCNWSPRVSEIIRREDKCWHTTFRSLHMSGKSNEKSNNANPRSKKQFPVDSFLVKSLFIVICFANSFYL